MAAIARRRKFLGLLLICCLVYFLFHWYVRTEDPINSNSNEIQEVLDDKAIVDSKTESSRLGHSSEIKSNPYIDIPFVTEEAKSYINDDLLIVTEENKASHFDSDFIQLQHLKEAMNRPGNMFIGFHSRVTIDPELERSGPTDDDDDGFYVTKEPFPNLPINNDNPSVQQEAVTALHYTKGFRLPNRDLEYSGPSDSNHIDITKSPTYPPQNADSKGSPELQATMGPGVVTALYQEDSTESTQVSKPAKNPALIIDTPGCKIPKMDPFDPTVADLFENRTDYWCPGSPLFLKAMPHGVIHLDTDILLEHYNATPDDMQCWYQAIIRKHEDPGNVRENDYKTTEVKELKFDVPMDEEYVACKCFFRNNYTLEQYFPLVKLKPEVEIERAMIQPPPSPLNIVLLGIDSISKLNFMRHFRQTKEFIKSKLNAFDMKGYTKVGDNTFPNLVPLLTGHFVEHYWNETMKDTFYFDGIDLIWKDYAKRGYRTFYAEDSPYTGTFNYLKRGFYDPPTDYYYRPMALAIEQSGLREDPELAWCLNSQMEMDFIYDYMKNFIDTIGPRPYIGFTMVSTITHDYLNSAGYADAPAKRMLEDLYERGVFNNSAVIIFSDHGLRFGAIRHTYIGKFEERMPFMYLNFPQWFLDQHPDFAKNLKINQDRLMTLFDIHATLKHLLHLNGEPMEDKEEYGISLFNEIPETRTCDDAHILYHWCPCNNFQPAPLDDLKVIDSSQAIVDHINGLLEPHTDVCAHLEISEVTDARLGLPNEVVLKFRRHENVVVNRTVILEDAPPTLGDYLITLTTKPGFAVFEGTVRYDSANNSTKVLGISRINMYGTQSKCINSQKLKIYCFCK